MTEEQIKAKAREQFPKNKFKQQIVIDAMNWAIKELQAENAKLKEKLRLSELENHYCLPWCSKLTNAKYLLKQCLQTSKASSCDNINIVTDTEQFLKE